jgi:hypothetical protein
MAFGLLFTAWLEAMPLTKQCSSKLFAQSNFIPRAIR